ncbi:MAG: ferredoxin--NADP reductase [Propionibacterium sp.]|nr:ferredoxin--NADP reductase [Propionibacterium sp.]
MSDVLKVRVTEVTQETPDAKSFAVEPVDHPEMFGYRAGQFLTFRIPTDWPEGAARSYSLCSSPTRDEPMRVAVKRTLGGYASNWFCDTVRVGDELEVLRPAGAFTPRNFDGDFLLLGAGSGITPMLSILKAVLDQSDRHVTLIYANRDERSVIFAQQLKNEADKHGERLTVVHWLEVLQGVPTDATWRSLLAPYADRQAFICGPAPFMNLCEKVLPEVGMPSDHIHLERFTSLTNDPFAESSVEIDTSGPMSKVEVTLDGETRTVDWPRSNNLLDVLRDAGMDAPYSCREGACSACACFVLEGEVELAHNEVLDKDDLADGLTLACQATPLTDFVKVSYDE